MKTTINTQIKIVNKVFNDLYFLNQDYRVSREKLYNLAKKDERDYRQGQNKKYYHETYDKNFTLDVAAKFWAVKHMIDALNTPKPRLRDLFHLRNTYVLSHIIVDKYGKKEIKKHLAKKDIEIIKNLSHTDFQKIEQLENKRINELNIILEV